MDIKNLDLQDHMIVDPICLGFKALEMLLVAYCKNVVTIVITVTEWRCGNESNAVIVTPKDRMKP